VPLAIRQRAAELGAQLRIFGEDFSCESVPQGWLWRGERHELTHLPRPDFANDAQLKNVSTALAAIEQYDPDLLDVTLLTSALEHYAPPGRFQVVNRDQQWILDVAHNPQAAENLAAQLHGLADPRDTTIVIGMMGDKQIEAVTLALDEFAQRWIVCAIEDDRAIRAPELARRIELTSHAPVELAPAPEAAFARAEALAGAGGRIVVCGSFRTVGPALQWLGLH
jgi:dihydrofolate synthase/folylpolyglutamate synthase